jgi:hypothetical protein
VYNRAQLYTMLLAGWFKLFGDSLVVARLLSVLFGSLLVVGVFWWTDAVAGRAAAWISALFVALGPTGIEMLQFARFYTLHALAFWLGAIGVYSLATGGLAGKWRQVAVAIGSALCLLLALHLQILTLMGGIGLGLWWVGFVLWRLLTHEQYRRHWPWIVLGLLICVVAAVTVAVFLGDLIAAMFARYLETPLHVMQHQGEVWFYHLRLIEYYPTQWPIFPFLVIFALAARPRPSNFAICVFGAATCVRLLRWSKELALPVFRDVFHVRRVGHRPGEHLVRVARSGAARDRSGGSARSRLASGRCVARFS